MLNYTGGPQKDIRRDGRPKPGGNRSAAESLEFAAGSGVRSIELRLRQLPLESGAESAALGACSLFDSFTESYVAFVAAGESLVFGAESAESAACSCVR